MNESIAQASALLDEAMAARARRELARAKDLCLQVLRMLAGTNEKRLTAITHNELAFVHDLLGDVHGKERHARCAIELAPRAELASLQLFHALADQGRWDEAMREAVRFLESRDSGEYRALLYAPGYREGFTGAARRLADDARRLLEGHLYRN